MSGGGKWQGPGGSQGSDNRVPSYRTHYVLLVFVKVPILLILVSVVLWLRGSRRVPEEQWILVAPGNAPFPRSANDMGP